MANSVAPVTVGKMLEYIRLEAKVFENFLPCASHRMDQRRDFHFSCLVDEKISQPFLISFPTLQILRMEGKCAVCHQAAHEFPNVPARTRGTAFDRLPRVLRA